jgi:hypothetical protein
MNLFQFWKSRAGFIEEALAKPFFLTLGSNDEYLRDRQIVHYQDRVQDIV